jgi:hypothetical protein
VRQEKFLNARYVPVVDAFTNAAVQMLYATNFQICIIKGYFGLAALDQHEALMQQTLQTPPVELIAPSRSGDIATSYEWYKWRVGNLSTPPLFCKTITLHDRFYSDLGPLSLTSWPQLDS